MKDQKLNELELEKVVGGMKKEELVPATGCVTETDLRKDVVPTNGFGAAETNLRKEDGDGGIADLTKTDPAKYEV